MIVGTRIDLRLCIIGVGWIRGLLLRVHCKIESQEMQLVSVLLVTNIRQQLTRHQILQIQLFLLLTLIAQADSGSGQQNGS